MGGLAAAVAGQRRAAVGQQEGPRRGVPAPGWLIRGVLGAVVAACASCGEPVLDTGKRTVLIEVPYTMSIFEETCETWCPKKRLPGETLVYCESIHKNDAAWIDRHWSNAVCSFEKR